MESTENQEFRRLKIFRKALGLTQTQLAESLGVAQSAYNRMEGGKAGITYKALKAMVETHRLNANWLIQGAGEMFATKAYSLDAAEPMALATGEDGPKYDVSSSSQLQVLESELNNCRAINALLQERIRDKDEMIEVLKGKN